jgi:hypothetical protein
MVRARARRPGERRRSGGSDVTENIRLARLIMLVGVLLLATAAGLTLWDLSGGDDDVDPVTITGDGESP